MQILHPPEWARPRGYSNGIATRGTHVFVAGQIGWDANCQFHSDDMVAQTSQALQNIVAVLAQAGAQPHHIVRMTWYVTSKEEYLANGKALGKVYREWMGAHYPVMTAVQVIALMEDRAKVEIEVTAVIPDPA